MEDHIQNWRRQLKIDAANWNDTPVISAVFHRICSDQMFNPEDLYCDFPWLALQSSEMPLILWKEKTTIAHLSWTYQFLNDARRHTLDKQLSKTRKISSAQLSNKTQIFTPSPLARWMCHNSIGRFWASRCIQRNWLNPLSPPIGELSTRELKDDRDPASILVLDPACGTGVLLMEAAQQLFEILKAEAALKRETFNPTQTMQHILENCIHGVDIDTGVLEIARVSLRLLGLSYGVHTFTLSIRNAQSEPWGSIQRETLLKGLQPNTYDIVLMNPPYQSTRRIEDAKSFHAMYPKGKSDLYAAFMIRALEWLKPNGILSALTMQSWLFLRQFKDLRNHLFKNANLRVIRQIGTGAFEGVQGEVTQTCVGVWLKETQQDKPSIGIREDGSQNEFILKQFQGLPNNKFLFWWTPAECKEYTEAKKLGALAPACQGMATGNNERFLKFIWEINPDDLGRYQEDSCSWLPYTKGAEGRRWFSSLQVVIDWRKQGFSKKQYHLNFGSSGGNGLPNKKHYGRRGIAYSKIGNNFSAREILNPGIIGNAGSAIFPNPENIPHLLCLLNHPKTDTILKSLNPTVNFTESDVNTIPIFPIPHANHIYDTLFKEFQTYSQSNECSLDFIQPQKHRWEYAMQWAQDSLRAGHSLPFKGKETPVSTEQKISHALGSRLGRFKNETFGKPDRIVWLNSEGQKDDLNTDWGQQLQKQTGLSIAELRDNLMGGFFKRHHLPQYQNRPIYWPITNKTNSMMLWIYMHNFSPAALIRKLSKLESINSHNRFTIDQAQFFKRIRQCLKFGPGMGNSKDTERVKSVVLNAFDGVLCNAAPLWPLLSPQWSGPQKKWEEMKSTGGRKSFGWSIQFKRYWPERWEYYLSKDTSLAYLQEQDENIGYTKRKPHR